jgi:hypothetical protein
MTPDKKIIVGTSTDATGIYSLRFIQMRGQTYTQADLAGIYYAFAMNCNSTSSTWGRGTWNTDIAGNVHVANILESDGNTIPPPDFTQIIDAQGNVTGGDMLSFGKDLLVGNGDFIDGSYIEIKVQ